MRLLMAFLSLSGLFAVAGEWHEYPENPVMLKGELMKLISPCVLKDGDLYRMWYAGYWGAQEIFMATSKDGLKWRSHGVALGREADGAGWNVLCRPCVIKDGDTYKMWYAGAPTWSTPQRIAFASSPDGTTWNKYPGNPVLSSEKGGTVAAPWVIKDGDTYKMWFVGIAARDSVQQLYYATSKDGLRWTKNPQPVLEGDAPWEGHRITSVCVVKDTAAYRMWYTAVGGDNKPQIGRALSLDGTTWRKDETPILHGSDPSVLSEKEMGKMWYGIGDGQGIGYATTVPETTSSSASTKPEETALKYAFHEISQNDDSPFGINCFQFPEMERKIGVKWLRLEFGWPLDSGWPEPRQGNFDWTRADALVKKAKEQNIRILGLLNGTARWASSAPSDASDWRTYPPRDLQDYATFVRTIVDRYKDDIQYWEIWNEPDLPYSWKAGPAAFVNILKTAYPAAKQANPRCKIVAMALSGGYHSFLKGVLANGGGAYFDIYSDHTYVCGEALKGRLGNIRSLFREYGSEKPIWVTETGYNSCIEKKPGESQEQEDARWREALKEQADYIVKEHVESLAEGVERIFLYQASRVGNRYVHENYGLLDETGQPLPAAVAYHLMVSKLTGATYLSELKYGREVIAYAFLKGQETVVCLWSEKDESILLNTGGAPIRVTDVSGRQREISITGGAVDLMIGRSPLFVEGINPELVRLKREFSFPSRNVPLVPGQEARMPLRLSNPLKDDLDIEISLWATPGCTANTTISRLHLKANEISEIPVIVRLDPSAPPGKYQVTARANYGKGFGRLESLLGINPLPPLMMTAQPKWLDASGVLGLELAVSNQSPEAWSGKVMAQADFKAQLSPAVLEFSKLQAGGSAKFPLMLALKDAPTDFSNLVLLGQLGGAASVKQVEPMRFLPCRKVSKLPVMNGSVDTATAWVNLNRTEQYIKLLLGKTGDWHGMDDLSAKVIALWDETSLYLTVSVRDDVHCQPYAGRGSTLFDGDSIQFSIDTLNNKSINYDNDDYEIVMCLTKNGPEMDVFAAPLAGASLPADSKLAIRKSGNGLIYEISIPWNSLGVTPELGRRLGFSLLINDNDGEGRKGFLQWTGGIGGRKNPTQFGALVLVDGGTPAIK